MSDATIAVVDRIEWFEGMLLSPQHFQLMSSRIDSLVAWQTLAAAPFSWGVRRLVLDHGLLSAGGGGPLRVHPGTSPPTAGPEIGGKKPPGRAGRSPRPCAGRGA